MITSQSIDPSMDAAFEWFPVVFGIVAVIVVCGIIYTIYAMIRNRGALRREGHDPDTFQAELVNRAMRSDLLKSTSDATPAAQTTEQKLAEIERLFTAGTITADERAAARQRIIAG